MLGINDRMMSINTYFKVSISDSGQEHLESCSEKSLNPFMKCRLKRITRHVDFESWTLVISIRNESGLRKWPNKEPDLGSY